MSIVIAMLNEADNLPYVLPLLPNDCQLILVDGHSTDETVDVARALRPDALMIRQQGRGKGDALLCGMRVATGDVIVAMDADGSTQASEIPRFIAALANGAQYVKGSRFLPGAGSDDMTRIRRFGNHFFVGLVNMLFGTAFTDLCYGFNAFHRSCIEHMPEDADGFEIETLMHIHMARAGVRVAEVPSYEASRRLGSSNLSVMRDGLRILRAIIGARLASRTQPTSEAAGGVLVAAD